MNTPCHKAFTMIELIFVIVIIGILAAIAIPKLAATRDDARITAEISHAKNILDNFQAYYTSQGNTVWQSAKANIATSVPLETSCGNAIDPTTELSPNTFVLCEDNVICLSFITIDEGNLTITSGTVETSVICEAVKLDPAIAAISNKSYQLGGEVVRR